LEKAGEKKANSYRITARKKGITDELDRILHTLRFRSYKKREIIQIMCRGGRLFKRQRKIAIEGGERGNSKL